MSEITYLRGDATGQVRALKGRGELRDQPRTARRSPLRGGPAAPDSRPTGRSAP
ncbi:hypothetical protein ACWC2T_24035 [Streptomyces sp. NPDC001393]